MKQIFSNFYRLMKRNKMVAFLNIAGLSLAFSVVFIVAIQVNYDFSYNHSIPDYKNIYRMKYLNLSDNTYGVTTSLPMMDKLVSDIPEFGSYGAASYSNINDKIRLNKNKSEDEFETEVYSYPIDNALLHMLSPVILVGDTSGIDNNKRVAILSESIAKRIFGSENCINKIMYRGGVSIRVGAVMKDIPKNNTFWADMWVLNDFYDTDAQEWSYVMYAKLKPDQAKTVNEKLEDLHQKNKDNRESTYSYANFSIDPINDIYMMPIPELQEASKSTTITLLSIGILVLLIALFNLLNLQISLTPTRMHLFNTRRVLGLSKTSLRLIIVSEAVLFVFLSVLISLFLVHLFSKTSLVQMFSVSMSIGNNLELILILSGMSLLLAMFIGLYPTFYATSYPIATVLKGSFAVSPQGLRLRRILLVAQFAISIAVLIIGGLIKSQHRYMQTRNWGIKTDEIVYLEGNFRDTTIFYDASNALVNDLKKNPNIKDCAFSRFIPGKVGMGWGRNIGDIRIQHKAWPVSHNFVEFFGLTMKEGESFYGFKSTHQGAMLVNENFVNKFQIPDIYGVEFDAFANKTKIFGVVKDFNFNMLTMPIEPLALVCSDDQWCNYILIKLTGNDIPGTFEFIRKTWKDHNQPVTDIQFLNQTLRDFYDKESNLSKIIFMLSIISLVISVMGVYGLILFTARVKRREIAIRRINGASTQSIIWLLQKGYLIPIGIASLIACPVSYLFIKSWLREYPYQVSINPLLFIGAILIIIIISALTMLFQCLRAANANPVEVIKTE